MSETIAILLATNTTLTGAIVWLVKRQDKRDFENRKEIQKLMEENNKVLFRVGEVLSRVEELLKNWRAH